LNVFPSFPRFGLTLGPAGPFASLVSSSENKRALTYLCCQSEITYRHDRRADIVLRIQFLWQAAAYRRQPCRTAPPTMMI